MLKVQQWFDFCLFVTVKPQPSSIFMVLIVLMMMMMMMVVVVMMTMMMRMMMVVVVVVMTMMVMMMMVTMVVAGKPQLSGIFMGGDRPQNHKVGNPWTPNSNTVKTALFLSFFMV